MENVAGTTRLASVPLGIDGRMAGPHQRLFDFANIIAAPERNEFAYAPTSDGQQFVVDVFAAPTKPALHVVLNWGRQGTQ